jgi:hypothetical protein
LLSLAGLTLFRISPKPITLIPMTYKKLQLTSIVTPDRDEMICRNMYWVRKLCFLWPCGILDFFKYNVSPRDHAKTLWIVSNEISLGVSRGHHSLFYVSEEWRLHYVNINTLSETVQLVVDLSSPIPSRIRNLYNPSLK